MSSNLQQTLDLKLIDSHAHFKNLDQAKIQVSKAQSEGVGYIVAVGYDLQSSKTAIQIANSIKNTKAVVGIHPHEAQKQSCYLDVILKLAKNKNVVAVGECGFDYHYMHSRKEIQRRVFLRHIEIAKEVKKPIVIHSREAMDETLSILANEGLPKKGCLMHCFSGSFKEARQAISLGCLLAFGGPITFKNSAAAKVAAKVPLGKILLETDSPYLTPVPFRGKRNTPSNLVLIAKKLAKLKGVSLEEAAKATTLNAKNFFNLYSF